jgi:hypothetical protein
MRFISVVCLAGFIATFSPSLCFGVVPPKQQAPVRTRSIDVGYVRNNSNERVSDQGGSAGRDRWGRVEVTFDSFPDFIDELEVRYFLLCKDGKTMLTGGQVCMYVKEGKGHKTSVYVFPNAVEKYGGEVVGVVVEFYVDGKFVLRTIDGKSTLGRWWENLPAVRGALTNWQGTPFRRTGAHKQEALRLE